MEGQWYLYTGHFWHPGWSVVNVSGPEHPPVERFIEGPDNTFTLQMTLYGDTMVTVYADQRRTMAGRLLRR